LTTWRFTAECTAYPELASSPTSFSRNALLATDTLKSHIRLGYGNISQPLFGDFGVKYIGEDNLKHLFASLQTETFNIVENWKGNLYCGITLNWNYTQRYVDIDISKYVRQQLVQYAHPTPAKPQHCPYAPNPITYRKDNQAPTLQDDSHLLNAAGKKCIQQIIGSFLCYARIVNPTILMALLAMPSQQSNPTEDTNGCIHQFLDYMATHPDAKI
jgi:hypothetical protein